MLSSFQTSNTVYLSEVNKFNNIDQINGRDMIVMTFLENVSSISSRKHKDHHHLASVSSRYFAHLTVSENHVAIVFMY